MKQVAVIGGGASGLMAAISAAYAGAQVTVYERTDRVGKKILATGNGRCNLTNINADVEKYHGKNPKFILSAFSQFSPADTIDFFERLGLLTKTEEAGKVYPYSDQASSVLDVLRMEIERLGIKTVTGFEAAELIRQRGKFRILSYEHTEASADAVILSVGGKAAPNLGSNGSGYAILKKLGHSVTPLLPSLVQIKTDTQWIKALKGIKINANAAVLNRNIVLREEYGEVLFTEYGVSGPPIFQISGCAAKGDTLALDVMPEYTIEEIQQMLRQRRVQTKSLEQYFTGMLNKRLGQTLLKVCGIVPFSRCSDTLSDGEIYALAKTIKHWEIPLKGTMSWNNAQVTAGGIHTAEVVPSTMESKLVKGVYITGELLDIDGDCGGFNLQWAWSSGYIAGGNAAI